MDLSLFEHYKVASKLPENIFQQICQNAAFTQEVSDFDPSKPSNEAEENIVQKLIQQEIRYDENDNYYRHMWKFYLDNEQLLKEVQDTASENLKALKRIYNIENYYETSLLPKLLSFPKQYLNRIKMVRHQ